MRSLSDAYIYEMSADKQPAITVTPGEEIEVETLDAFGGQITSNQDTLEDMDMDRANPATGPIYVDSAKPGDSLVIKIKDIQVHSPGVQGIVPGFGFLSESYDDPEVTLHEIDEVGVSFSDIVLPQDPMIGTIGVAPEKGSVHCHSPGAHGGNLDTPDIRPGSTLYLPIYHEGALLSLGDVHALQGDGEVCGVSIEVNSTTIIEVDTLEKEISTPMVENDEEFITLGSAETLEKAGKIALEAMIRYLAEEKGFSNQEAYKFSSIATDMKVSQVVNPLKTIRVSVKKKHLLNRS